MRDTSAEPADPRAQSFTYGYDANGNLTGITVSTPDAAVGAYAIGYTGLNQVEPAPREAEPHPSRLNGARPIRPG